MKVDMEMGPARKGLGLGVPEWLLWVVFSLPFSSGNFILLHKRAEGSSIKI